MILIENYTQNAHTVNTDNHRGGFMAAEYLIKKGRKRIALICGGLKEGSRCGLLRFRRYDRSGGNGKRKKHVMKIPENLAVIGFDDSTCSAFLNPPLTTVRQPIDKLGDEVLDTAIDAVEGKLKSFKHILLTPELILREPA